MNKIIQGLEDYSYDEIIDLVNDFIMDRIWDSGHSADDIKLTDIRLHGSRLRGQARDDSDLDAVVEYDGDIREDDFFSILNDEDPLYIDDVRVDINPIKEDLDLYMKRSDDYDREQLELESRVRRLEKKIQNEMKRDELNRRVMKLERMISRSRKYELLGGLIGKTNATKEDCVKVIGLLAGKLGIDEDTIHASGSAFKFSVGLFKEADIKDVEKALDPEAIIPHYVVTVEDTKSDKIVLKIEKGAKKFVYEQGSAEDAGKSEYNVVKEVKGLTITSAEKLTNNIVKALGEVGLSNNCLTLVKATRLLADKFNKSRNAFMSDVLEKIEKDNEALGNVEWSSDDTKVIGKYHLERFNNKTGKQDDANVVASYKIIADLSTGAVERYDRTYGRKNAQSEQRRFDGGVDSLIKVLRELVTLRVGTNKIKPGLG